MDNAGTGFLLLVVAGVLNASFALPMKFTRRWAWENTWAVWSALALLLMPLIAAVITVPQLSHEARIDSSICPCRAACNARQL